MDKYLAFKIDEAIFPPAGIYKDTTGVAKLAGDIILILTGVAGILSFIFIIIGGIKIITAAGDEKKMASAQATITYAIIGLVVTALAFVILRVVQYFLKSNVAIT